MQSWLISPLSPTGNNQQIDLAGLDLWINQRIDNVFVYPVDLDIDRLKQALSRTLSLWPLIAGRFLLLNDEHYIIKMSDNGIPLSFVENTELTQWPLDLNVVRDAGEGRLQMFIDEVPTNKLYGGSVDEPLFRLKITRLVQSGEWIMGASYAHVLGDGFACVKFLNTLSRLYQQLEPLEPSPIFERRLWSQENADSSFLPFLRHLTDARSTKENLEIFMKEQTTHDQINMHFSGEQLAQLRKLADNSMLTIQDVMTAYIILTLNTHCCEDDEQLILHANTIVNYRGVADSIAAPSVMANCSMKMLSEDFEDRYSLSSIAKSIRHSIIRLRDPSFLQPFLATEDGLKRHMARNHLDINIDHALHGIICNSNYRYDWADLVDFGHKNKCRFYTEGTTPLFLRVYRCNPIFDGTHWIERDRDGAEVAFRINKTMKQKFIDAWQRDVKENFARIKQ